MNKLKIFILLFLLFFPLNPIYAQSRETLTQFAEIQRTLAGDPSEWRVRATMKKSGFFYHVPIDPARVLDSEESGRYDALDTEPADEDEEFKLGVFKLYFDEDSGKGSLWRALRGGKQFSGNYKLTSNKETELEIIKDIYEQITSRVARFGEPSDDNPASCLAENTGMCRHMATILQESLEEYGIKSEQIFSTTHTWVRVTLSDPRYADNLFAQFDLDPTWYAQPIPLPPRKGIWISDPWKKAMMAQVPSGSPTPTPTPTITPTPTLTPTPTPTVSVTPEPTAPEEEEEGSNNSGSYNNEDTSPGGVYWVVPR